MVSYPLTTLGDVCRARGDLVLARALYEEAVAEAQRSGDLDGLVPALAGLAGTLGRDDLDAAARALERGMSHGAGMGCASALLAAGWVARGRRERAIGSQAEGTRLEEWGSVSPGGDDSIGYGRAPPAPENAFVSAASDVVAPVAIQSLGRFRVFRAGRPVPPGEWQSKKARDVLKILIARRGRATPREYLMEALWPDEDPRRVGNRLSVALSTLHAVLDPARRFGPGHFIAVEN